MRALLIVLVNTHRRCSMAAVAIDSLEYAHQLEAVGMPREQAEAVAKGLTTMFIHNFDSLVTKDYLDTRFSELGIKFGAEMDRRFSQVDKQFADLRLEFHGDINEVRGELRGEMGKLRSDLSGEIGELRGKLGGEIAEIRGKLNLHGWMLAVLMAGVFMPLFQKLY